jgi:multiple sugar transport system substrate-binding protein
MRGSKFQLVNLLVIVSIVMLLGGTPVLAADPTPTTLTVWVMPNGADPQKAIDTEIAAFNKVHPEITVKTEVIGWGDAYGKIQAAIQGGEGPDITQLGTTWVPTFGAMGGLRPFSEAEIKDMGGAANFVPASWDTASIDGNTVSVPWFADVRALAYRKDVLDKAGVKPEEAFKDLDSFVAALQKIKAADPKDAQGNPIAPFLHPGRNDWNVWQNASVWIWAYGGDLLDKDGKKAAFNSDKAAAGVTRFNGLYGLGLTPKDTLELNSAQSDSRFGQGTVAVYLTGPWVISQARDIKASGWITDAAANLAFAPFPAGPGGQATFVGGSNLAVMKNTKNVEAAMTFMKYLLSKESQNRYANAIGMLPATVEAQKDPAFVQDPMFSVFVKAAPTGKTSMNIAKWGQVENNLQTALQALWEDVAALGVGKTIDEPSVKKSLDEAAVTVNTLLAQ